VQVSLFHAAPAAEQLEQTFHKQNILARLQAIDSLATRKGLDALDPALNPLVSIGTEHGENRQVTKNSYGVLNLSWRAAKQPQWPDRVAAELGEIRRRIKETHGRGLRFLIWAGMGGSAEDKSMYNACGLLSRGPRCYVLDSTDPAKLKAILEDMQRRSRLPLEDALRSTLVVGMAMGMTSYEPVVNLEKLYCLFERHGIDSRPNFLYMTLPGSLLDRFAGPRGSRRVELQLDGANSVAGRHTGPLTRGSLYPLGLAGVDLRQWIHGACLTEEDIHGAWRLASFLDAEGDAGRDHVTLLLPSKWTGAGLWTKQDFEESLGKSEEAGIKIFFDEKPKLANFLSPKDGRQRRCFVVVQVKGMDGPDAQKAGMIRRAGYPVAVVTLPKGSPLSAYMQFIHYTVCGLGVLRNMNFVTQPGVELYKTITAEIVSDAAKAGAIEKSAAWKAMKAPGAMVRFGGVLTLCFPHVAGGVEDPRAEAPAIYASLLKKLAANGVRYGELTFFGDTRYSRKGRAARKSLDRAAERVFRSRLKMPVDVYEGPAMNHSYHEMVIGHGHCFSTVLLSEKQEQMPEAGYRADYHVAQFLATQAALARRGRPVVAILLKDLEPNTLARLDHFFQQVATNLGRRAL
jgi:glucose-6-phosphate isomerase